MRWLFTGVALFRELDARSSLRQRVSIEDASTGTLWARTSVGYASSSSFLTGAVPRNKSNAVPGGSWPVVDSSRHVRRWRSGGMHCQRLTLALLPLQCLADERQQPRRGDCGDFCCQRCAQKAAV